jgi:hypothetical protein
MRVDLQELHLRAVVFKLVLNLNAVALVVAGFVDDPNENHYYISKLQLHVVSNRSSLVKFAHNSSNILIKWNNKSVLMETKFGSLTITFKYENHSGILGEIKKRPISFIWPNRYDVRVYLDHFQDCIYFLAIAIKDNINRGRPKG